MGATVAEYTDADVQALADHIVDAAMRGIRAGSATLARTILDAGWRREREPAGYLIRVRDNEWQHYRPRDVEILVRDAGDRVYRVAADRAEELRHCRTHDVQIMLGGAESGGGELEDAAATDEAHGAAVPAPWETYGDGGTPGGDDRG